MADESKATMILGCSFLVDEHPPEQVFAPEDFSQDERMIGDMVEKFVQGSVLPQLDALESLTPGAMAGLLKEAGGLGLLALDVPEAYGGMAMPKRVGMLVAEKLSPSGSFQVGHGAHTGIGTLPIVYFGTPEQKQKYLPRLATGELLGAYALTEAGSGSDAMAARAKAVPSADGSHFVLNGEKMWITNAGFADLFIVFAQVPPEEAGGRDRFTAFILEKDMPGFRSGNEEKKLGIKGSSTRTLVLEDVKVPAANVLGRIGRGAAIAFNILNVGRFKLGAGAVGGAELAMLDAVRYGNGRQQFGRPITQLRHDQAQDRRDGRARVRRPEHGLPHGGLHRPEHRQPRQGGARLRRPGRRARHPRVHDRVLDDEGLLLRGARLLRGRVRADPRRLRLLAGVRGRALLPRQPHQPHLRGHERDQPPHHRGRRAQEGGQEPPARLCARQAADRCAAGAGRPGGRDRWLPRCRAQRRGAGQAGDPAGAGRRGRGAGRRAQASPWSTRS